MNKEEKTVNLHVRMAQIRAEAEKWKPYIYDHMRFAADTLASLDKLERKIQQQRAYLVQAWEEREEGNDYDHYHYHPIHHD